MKRREVLFSPEAQADLIGLYDYISRNDGPIIAMGYIERIEKYCLGFDVIGERGTRRDDIRPGLRIIGFERRTSIAFHVNAKRVTIDRVLYGGRHLERALGRGEKRE